jgi:putative membrane protein
MKIGRHSLLLALVFAFAWLAGTAGPAAAEPATVARTIDKLSVQANFSNSFGIESGRLGMQRAADPAVRRYAAKLVADHERLARRMATLVAEGGYAPPAPALDSRHRRWLDQISAAPEGAFDRTFVEVQVAAHVDAINLFSTYESEGRFEPLVALSETYALPMLHCLYRRAQQFRENFILGPQVAAR